MFLNTRIWKATLTIFPCAAVACGIVGFQYEHNGQRYTMTRESIDYYEESSKSVQTRFGVVALQTDPQKVKGACDALQGYVANAPDPGSFTSAKLLLEVDAANACSRWQSMEATARAEAETKKLRQEREEAIADAENRRREEAESRQRAQLQSQMDRDSRLVADCEKTADARAARARHLSIIQSAPDDTVKKKCTPRKEMISQTGQCTDANGFVRTCTKQVPGEVVGYTCPKSIDDETRQLGLFRLQLIEYPYPQDFAIRLRDDQCDEAKARLDTEKAASISDAGGQ